MVRWSAMLLALAAHPALAWEPVKLSSAIRARLPAGHVARMATCSRTFDPPKSICIVVATRPDEGDQASPRRAPPRLLLAYRLSGTAAVPIARNDRIVLRRDEGGQCDPVADGGAIAVEGRFFTLEQGVACGQHWTDYTTFRFDPRVRDFVWHSRIYESWRMNDDPRPNADAMVADGRSVSRADPRRPIRLGAYLPR